MNIIGKMNTPVEVKKSEADKWWDGLRDKPGSQCGSKLVNGAVDGCVNGTPTYKTDSKACFNEGLKWSEGFVEWWNSLPICAGDGSTLRKPGEWHIDLPEAQIIWNSIHAFKTKQAEGKV